MKWYQKATPISIVVLILNWTQEGHFTVVQGTVCLFILTFTHRCFDTQRRFYLLGGSRTSLTLADALLGGWVWAKNLRITWTPPGFLYQTLPGVVRWFSPVSQHLCLAISRPSWLTSAYLFFQGLNTVYDKLFMVYVTLNILTHIQLLPLYLAAGKPSLSVQVLDIAAFLLPKGKCSFIREMMTDIYKPATAQIVGLQSIGGPGTAFH